MNDITAPPDFISDRSIDDHNTILRLAMRAARMGTWMRDLANSKVVWNPELEDLFGLEPGSFGGTEEAFLALIHPEDADNVAAAVASSISGGAEYIVEFRFRHSSGEWRWMEGRGKPSCDSAGRPVRIYGIGIDITERKIASIARGRLAAIVESSHDAVVSKTLEGIVTSWNAAAERLFGYTAAEMIGGSIKRLIPPEFQDEETVILERIARGETLEHYDTNRVRKTGERVSVSLTISPIRDETGTIIGASKIAHDISERKRSEAALRDSEARLRDVLAERERLLESERAARSDAERLSRIKDEFLATLSHELRTPLNAIQGWSILLRQPTLSPADRQRGIDIIERNARAQTQIINDLLDMSRIVSGKIHLEVQRISLQDVISAAIEAVRPSATAKNIRIQTMLDSTIRATRGDPNRLQQVLWNLLTNAVKFTPSNGRIHVVLERVNSHVEIVVEDTGAGIDPTFLPYVFDRFRQWDASTTRRHGGLGIGLSIVKTLVELHGGSVRVKSPGVDLGSTFVVSLPIPVLRHPEDERVREVPESPHHAEMFEPPRLENVTVLVVDDEPDSRTLTARILEERGAVAVCVGSAREALATLKTQSVDLMLSDIGMPEMDGYDLIKQLRRLTPEEGGRLPAVAITAYARAEDRQRSLLAGYQMHIAKPVEAIELIAGISSLLKLSRD